MAATPQAVCPHSLWHVNGTWQLSETTMAAALAGSRGVPCVCVTGDQAICAEAAARIPAVSTAVVKWGIGAQNARSLVPAEAREVIYAAVRAGLERRAVIAPFVIPGPFRINLSDRDPRRLMFPAEVTGDDLWETVHRALNTHAGGHFGENPLDDRSFRWPA
jgi:D-aminopeptidase